MTYPGRLGRLHTSVGASCPAWRRAGSTILPHHESTIWELCLPEVTSNRTVSVAVPSIGEWVSVACSTRTPCVARSVTSGAGALRLTPDRGQLISLMPSDSPSVAIARMVGRRFRPSCQRHAGQESTCAGSPGASLTLPRHLFRLLAASRLSAPGIVTSLFWSFTNVCVWRLLGVTPPPTHSPALNRVVPQMWSSGRVHEAGRHPRIPPVRWGSDTRRTSQAVTTVSARLNCWIVSRRSV